jgi:molybdate transport system ATP-binding protein
MIEARLAKRYPPARDSEGFSLDVDFTLRQGLSVLFGPSGSGKTLTLDCIAGFVKPDAGRIMLDGRILFDAQAHVFVHPRDRRCGYVFQTYALFPHMTVRENLIFATPRSKRRERDRRIAEMLERFRLTDVAGRRPHEISGGQKQRCSIARALISDPRVLLLDEPARGLDAPLREELYEILRQVRAEFGTPVVVVTHSLDECFELADEMLVFRHGRVVQTGAPAAVCEAPANIELARLLGIYNILPVEIRALDPTKNTSLLRYLDHDIQSEYYPGRLKGDRVHLLVTPGQLRAAPRLGRPATNQAPFELERVVEMPDHLRLEFAGGLQVETPRHGFDRHNREWLVEFPSRGLRIL